MNDCCTDKTDEEDRKGLHIYAHIVLVMATVKKKTNEKNGHEFIKLIEALSAVQYKIM